MALLVTYPDKLAVKEAEGLAEAADYTVARIITQRYLLKAKYGVGSGKAEEIKQIVRDLDLEVVLFDERIRTTQVYNLAKLVGVEVIDREKLILEIFSKRASTAEAKLQVQLAELRYEITRARDKVRLAKIGEQPGFFGLGKYEVDIYFRAIKKRISALNHKLNNARKQRELYRIQRQKLNILSCSLAGYTGAGKTSLFNHLTGEAKEVDAGAFTTLTTSTRALDIEGSKILISDTVGFINRLPTYMIESFKSTLEELTYTSLVLLILDASEPLADFSTKYQSCINTLAELQVSPSRIILVFNKSDLTSNAEMAEKTQALAVIGEKSATISAKLGTGIDKLKSIIKNAVLEYTEVKMTFIRKDIARYSQHLEWLRKTSSVEIISDNDIMTALIKGPLWAIECFNARIAKL